MASISVFFVLLFSLFSLSSFSEAYSSPPLKKGLSWTFYKSSCPNLESIVRKELKKVFKKDIGLAAALLRIHFHDCFVKGCDGSVLLDGSASGPSEQDAPPNLTLRPAGFKVIDDLQDRVEKECGRVVSCADITALAARDSVALSGGPDYSVPLGRRDGLNFATRNTTLANLPAPTSDADTLIAALSKKNLDATDLVALSGGHTIGIGHCPSFTDRLYPTQDSTMDEDYADILYETCPAVDTPNTTVLDIRTPNLFDNKYYVDLMKREGLFTSDQDLYTNDITKPIVKRFAKNETLFFEHFAYSMVKMGQLSVLTGKKGEIRANCSERNPESRDYLSSVVDEDEHAEL
ncbi:peroxidase 12-like [Tasmannia lanceolata]|uniref:peroxidase 12-like n=1 Tax=Tasmannia lanceolata TaxID=3420 RepID=UPI004064306C